MRSRWSRAWARGFGAAQRVREIRAPSIPTSPDRPCHLRLHPQHHRFVGSSAARGENGMRWIVAGVACALAACATPYQEDTGQGGVSATPEAGGVWRIEASLSSSNSLPQLADYMQLKAADTALANGAIGFVVIDSKDTSQTGTVTTAGYASTHTSTHHGRTSSYTTYTPPSTTNYTAPGEIMHIRLVHANEGGAGDFV